MCCHLTIKMRSSYSQVISTPTHVHRKFTDSSKCGCPSNTDRHQINKIRNILIMVSYKTRSACSTYTLIDFFVKLKVPHSCGCDRNCTFIYCVRGYG